MYFEIYLDDVEGAMPRQIEAKNIQQPFFIALSRSLAKTLQLPYQSLPPLPLAVPKKKVFHATIKAEESIGTNKYIIAANAEDQILFFTTLDADPERLPYFGMDLLFAYSDELMESEELKESYALSMKDLSVLDNSIYFVYCQDQREPFKILQQRYRDIKDEIKKNFLS